MKKKLLLSAILICIGIFAFGIINASAETYGDLTYEIVDSEITITDCNTSASGELVIPNTIEDYPVTSIGYEAFRECSKLTRITIPDSVTSIGDWAFFSCTSLTSINIPDGVTYIGELAFIFCESLTNITIPGGVTGIGEGPFRYCSKLKSIDVATDNANFSSKDGVLFNKDKTTLIQYPIGNERNIYRIPDSVMRIGGWAFCDCESLTYITIPDSVIYIGDKAFSYCDGLTSIIIPDSVISIGYEGFSDCMNLYTVYRPISVLWSTDVFFGSYNHPILFINVCKISYYLDEEIIGTEYVELNKNAKMLTPPEGKSYIYTVDGEIWTGKNITNNVNVTVYEETSVDIIRATSTENSLKFVSKASISPNDEISSFGTTFIPLWLFELGATNTAIVKYDNSAHNISNGQTFGATLSGIPALFKDMAIVGKSFVKNANGEYIWSDAKYASVSNTTLKTVE